MNYNIRIIKNNELKYLSNFLYEAIFIPEGFAPPPKSIINSPELQILKTLEKAFMIIVWLQKQMEKSLVPSG